jgi:hypothetical protein
MAEADTKRSEIVAILKDPHRHHGIAGKFPFVKNEEQSDDDAEDDQADYFCGSPGVGDTAKFETEEEHEGSADDGQRAGPVDCFEAVPNGRFRVVEVEEEE